MVLYNLLFLKVPEIVPAKICFASVCNIFLKFKHTQNSVNNKTILNINFTVFRNLI